MKVEKMLGKLLLLKSKSQKFYLFSLWLLAVVVILFYQFYILPRKDISFMDTGWYLYVAKAAVTKHFSLDPLANLTPGLYLNSLFMKLGVSSYVGLSWVCMCCVILSGFSFFYGFRRKLLGSGALPLLIIVSISFGMIYLLNYHNLPPMLLLLSIGFFFSALNANLFFLKKLFFIFSGAFLLCASVADIALIPAGLCVFSVIWLLNKNEDSVLFFVFSFIFCLIVFFLIWKFFLPPMVHISTIYKGQPTLFSRLIFYAVPQVFTGLAFLGEFLIFALVLKMLSYIFLHLKSKQLVGVQYLEAISFIFQPLFLFLIASLLESFHFFYEAILFFHRRVVLDPSVSAHLMLAIFTFAAVLFFDRRLIKLYYVMGFFLLFWLLESSTSGMPFWFVLPSYAVALTAFSIVIIFSVRVRSQCEVMLQFLCKCFLLIFGLACIIPQLNYSFRAYPPHLATQPVKNFPVLQGTLLSKVRMDGFNALYRAYINGGCQHKLFMTYAASPLLYYLFDRPAPFGRSWYTGTRLGLTEREDDLIKLLSNSQHWCVFIYTQKRPQGVVPAKLLAWASNHAEQSSKITVQDLLYYELRKNGSVYEHKLHRDYYIEVK